MFCSPHLLSHPSFTPLLRKKHPYTLILSLTSIIPQFFHFTNILLVHPCSWGDFFLISSETLLWFAPLQQPSGNNLILHTGLKIFFNFCQKPLPQQKPSFQHMVKSIANTQGFFIQWSVICILPPLSKVFLCQKKLLFHSPQL